MFATTDWLDMFPNARLFHLASSVSDHCCLLLRFNQRVKCKKQRRLFRFESMWLKDEKCGNIVKEIWAEGALQSDGNYLSTCMEKCREALSRWNMHEFGHIGKKLVKAQDFLQVLEASSGGMSNTDEICQQRAEVNRLLDLEERMWKQRSGNPWLKKGDRNTIFFHMKASNKKQRNTISGVMDESNTWQESDEKISEVIIAYYQNLFTTSQPDISDEFLEAIKPGVTPQMNSSLIRDFSAIEVKKALDQMYPLKSPGPDGMPPLFYQHFWPVVGDSVVTCVLNFLNNGTTPHNFHETHIVLIPKVKCPTKVSEYRPISLSNVVYNWLPRFLLIGLRLSSPHLLLKTKVLFYLRGSLQIMCLLLLRL